MSQHIQIYEYPFKKPLSVWDFADIGLKIREEIQKHELLLETNRNVTIGGYDSHAIRLGTTFEDLLKDEQTKRIKTFTATGHFSTQSATFSLHTPKQIPAQEKKNEKGRELLGYGIVFSIGIGFSLLPTQSLEEITNIIGGGLSLGGLAGIIYYGITREDKKVRELHLTMIKKPAENPERFYKLKKALKTYHPQKP